MTNYEAIMNHRGEFKKWANDKDAIDDVLRKRLIADVMANCIECDECPFLLDCFAKGSRKPCLEYMKELLDEDYKDTNTKRS